MTNAVKMMDTPRMLHKANQIASFFESYPKDKAVEGVADHIRKFWTPPMREQLKTYIADENGAELHKLVLDAAATL